MDFAMHGRPFYLQLWKACPAYVIDPLCSAEAKPSESFLHEAIVKVSQTPLGALYHTQVQLKLLLLPICTSSK